MKSISSKVRFFVARSCNGPSWWLLAAISLEKSWTHAKLFVRDTFSQCPLGCELAANPGESEMALSCECVCGGSSSYPPGSISFKSSSAHVEQFAGIKLSGRLTAGEEAWITRRQR